MSSRIESPTVNALIREPIHDTFSYSYRIFRIGNRTIADRLCTKCTHDSNTETGSDRYIIILADLKIPALRKILKKWLREGHRIGIIIPTSILINHSVSFYTTIESSFNAANCGGPYSIAVRAFDIRSSTQSLTEITMHSPGNFTYKSSIQGAVDKFPFDLYVKLRSVTLMQLAPRVHPGAFTTSGRGYLNAFFDFFLQNAMSVQALRQLWVSPRVLLESHVSGSPLRSLLEVFGASTGQVRIERVMLTGIFDEEYLERHSVIKKSIFEAFPYLIDLDYYSAAVTY